MSNVVAIGAQRLDSDRRAGFLNSVAASFDAYVETNGQEPDALVYTLCGAAQPSQIAWDIQGASEGSVSSVLSLAAVHCLTEAGASRQGL